MPEWSGAKTVDGVQREGLILEHIPLLKHIVGRMSFDVPGGMDRDDLYGFGMLGLIHAADAWDASRGLKFSTFAYPRIRGAILDELRRTDFLPRGRRERVREVDNVIERLEQQKGERPTPEEIAEAIGGSLADVDEILLSAASASQASLDEGPSETLSAMLSDPQSVDPVGCAEWEELRTLLADVIEDLPEQERTVITLYYGEELMLKEISGVLGVTESRVSQVHSRALYRMNRVFSSLTGSSEPTR